VKNIYHTEAETTWDFPLPFQSILFLRLPALISHYILLVHPNYQFLHIEYNQVEKDTELCLFISLSIACLKKPI
jgi:hypothetical protein